MRLKARNTLAEAANSGKLLEAAASLRTNPSKAELDEVRLKAKSTLAEAASSGTLEQAFLNSACKADDVERLRQKAREALFESASQGSLQKVLSGEISGSQHLGGVRNRAAERLITASGNGELEKVIASISTQGNRPDSVEDMRLKTRNLLTKSCNNGELQQAILKAESMPSTDTQELRSKTAKALQESLASGALAGALSTINAQGQVA